MEAERSPLVVSKSQLDNGSTTQISPLLKTTFLVGGAAWFIVFFAVIQTMKIYDSVIYPHRSFAVAAQSAFSYSQLATTVGMLIVGRSIPTVLATQVAAYTQLALGPAFPLIVFCLPSTLGFYMTLTLVALQQMMLGVGLTTTFSIAGVLSTDMAGLVALGIPVAGMLAFVSSEILMCIASDLMNVTLLFSMSTVCVGIFVYLLQGAFKNPWVKLRLDHMETTTTEGSSGRDLEHDSDAIHKRSPPLAVLRACLVPVLGIFLTLTSLFVVYPALSISLRDDPPRFGATIVGLHIVGEITGRALVTLGMALPRWTLLPIAILRFGLIPLLTFIGKLEMDHWLRSPMALYTIQVLQGWTMGWVVSSCFVDAPTRMVSDSDKQLSGILTTTASNLGVPAGTLILHVLKQLGVFTTLR